MRSLVHLANLFYVASYFSGNVLRLRLFAVVGGVCLMAYFALRPDPVLPAAYWNGFFAGLNAFKLAQIRNDRARRRTQAQKPRRPEPGTLQTAPFLVTRMVDSPIPPGKAM